MPEGTNNRSLVIDTNALSYQLAAWIEMRLDGKTRKSKDSRVKKAHDIISKYTEKFITPTIKSEFFDGDRVKQNILEDLRNLFGIRSRLFFNLLDKPLLKLKERIKELNVSCVKSDIDSIEIFYSNIISTLTQEEIADWKRGYGENKPLMPEHNDRTIIAECKKAPQKITIISNDRAFTFPKYKIALEREHNLLIEAL